ncbi:MAG TPA: arginine--tRNA ligase [Gammaproteobacteria bacterium]|nr:arginine--tRNA ligase [Gammaproteobacteria bacterium]
MTDPRSLLAARLRKAVGAAFGGELSAVDPMVRRSERADYQADLAMGLAKSLKRAPRQVAEAVVANLDLEGVAERVEIAGPGFINFTLAQSFLETALGTLAQDAALGIVPAERPERVVVDYSAPNVAKEMHVGHLRSTIIGDALARLLGALGHEIIRQNHLGDWGTPFGMLIEHLVDVGGADRSGADAGADAEADVGELSEFYRAARAKFDRDPGFAERARRRVVLLQSGDPQTLALWKKLVDVSKKHFRALYQALGVLLGDDDIRAESFYNPMLPDIAADLERRGIARESDGALCVFVPGFENRDGEPLPLIVRKQDGGFGYAATDLAALRYRTQELLATRLLYVVGTPQQQHFAMVFAVASLAGWLAPPARAEHVAFGSILGPDKKMLKTRAGESVRLAALIGEAIDRAEAELRARDPDLDADTRRALAAKIGIGALKYADLANDRIKDYIFDWERMLALEGRTGPYLQYAHARIRSILRKAAEAGIERAEAPPAIALTEGAERALGLELLGFGGAVADAAESLKPHRLAGYLYDLATAFTKFFESCPVLRAPDESTRAARLALCELTAAVLARGLGLLGIEAPERM